MISRAAEALRDCPCNQEPDRNGCFRCVKPYRSQFGPGEPDRDRARQMMEAILQKWDSLSRTETGIDASIRDAMVESALEKRLLNALATRYGDDALTPQVLSGGRRGFVLRAGPKDRPRLWTIEPQVQIDARFKGLPRKRIDFLLTPTGQTGAVPVVLEMDGLEYHADTVAQDLLDRMLMIRSGQVQVWTLAWADLDAENRSFLNPLAEPALSADKVGRLARVGAFPGFADKIEGVRALQGESSLEGFWRLLDCVADDGLPGRSILTRGFVATGRPLDQLPRQASLTEEGRQFLLTPGLTEHIGAGGLDLYLACKQISPTEWAGTDEDIRLLLRAELPDPGHEPAAKALYAEAWRGLWRIFNLFQGLRGFHVELAGLETLSPPDMSVGTEPTDADTEAWLEARALCDDLFHPLIDALVAAEVPGPDRFGDDLLVEGRVVGMMEFGWEGVGVAIAETPYEGGSWRLIPFDPESDPIGETVTRVIQALKEMET